jgi:hypothetical protein
MIKLIYILPFLSFAQTWVMQYDHKLLPDTNYVIDSIIGNGHTFYLACNATLIIKKYAENVKFGTIRYTYERCKPFNVIKVSKNIKAIKVVYPKKCIRIETI